MESSNNTQSESHMCYVLQQIQRFEGQTNIEQICVHMNQQAAINKLVTIVMNFIDKIISGNDDIYLHDEYKNYTKDRDTLNDTTFSNADDIDKYIKSYIEKIMKEHKKLTKDQKRTLREFMYLSDSEEKVPEPMDVVCPNNVEMRVGDGSENNIYEITHSETTLSLMKSYFI